MKQKDFSIIFHKTTNYIEFRIKLLWSFFVNHNIIENALNYIKLMCRAGS
jgi:hypothetical protein